jgi:hypothetical protein
MSQRFNSFSIVYNPYNKRGRVLLRGIIIIRRVV